MEKYTVKIKLKKKIKFSKSDHTLEFSVHTKFHLRPKDFLPQTIYQNTSETNKKLLLENFKIKT